MREVMEEVMRAAGSDMGLMVKMNMHDGFRRGMQTRECLEVAKELERLGAHALVLSAGFVSKAPMEVMRGAMPLRTLSHYMDPAKFWWLKVFVRLFGRSIIPTRPWSEGYFLDEAKLFRAAVKMPLIYVGGLVSLAKMEEVLEEGFQGLQVARALIRDTDFVKHLQDGTYKCSACGHSNYCIGRMYTLEMRCHTCVKDMPKSLEKEVESLERLGADRV